MPKTGATRVVSAGVPLGHIVNDDDIAFAQAVLDTAGGHVRLQPATQCVAPTVSVIRHLWLTPLRSGEVLCVL